MIDADSPSPVVSATAKFYIGFFIALALVVVLAFGLGYRAGVAHAEHRSALHARPAP